MLTMRILHGGVSSAFPNISVQIRAECKCLSQCLVMPSHVGRIERVIERHLRVRRCGPGCRECQIYQWLYRRG